MKNIFIHNQSRCQIEMVGLKCPFVFFFSFSSPGEQGRPVYLPSRDEDGGRGVSRLAQLDVELGRRG